MLISNLSFRLRPIIFEQVLSSVFLSLTKVEFGFVKSRTDCFLGELFLSSIMSQRSRDIEQQIAHLRWRRQQNERLIKSSLEATRVLKQKDTILGLTVDQSSERELWTNSVVLDELSRPLVVTDEQLHNIQYEEDKVRKRLWKVGVNFSLRV